MNAAVWLSNLLQSYQSQFCLSWKSHFFPPNTPCCYVCSVSFSSKLLLCCYLAVRPWIALCSAQMISELHYFLLSHFHLEVFRPEIHFRIYVLKFFWPWRTFIYMLLVKRGAWRKEKPIPLQAWTGPDCSRRWGLPDFKTIGTWSW